VEGDKLPPASIPPPASTPTPVFHLPLPSSILPALPNFLSAGLSPTLLIDQPPLTGVIRQEDREAIITDCP